MNIRGVRHLIGTSQLGIGMAVVADILLLHALAAFLVHVGSYPEVWLTLVAWTILIAAFIVGQIALWRFGDELPAWALPVWLAMLATVTVLDIIGFWGMSDPPTYPAAALACGAGLLLAATVRPFWNIVVASTGLAIILAITIASEIRPNHLTIAPDIIAIAVAVLPPILGARVIFRFRRLIQRELDLAYSQSTTSIGAFSVGMQASDDLVRLDGAAEQLLEAVASGTEALPLTTQSASAAAALATELRLRLVQDHRQSWLHHAVEESEVLMPTVVLVDPHGLANRLDPNERDGLLTTVWLLAASPRSRDHTVTVHIGADAVSRAHAHTLSTFQIAITTTGVPRRQVDHAVWHAMRRVGLFSAGAHETDFNALIECNVGDQADRDTVKRKDWAE